MAEQGKDVEEKAKGWNSNVEAEIKRKKELEGGI
jgi:hypothetical protein